MATVEHFIHGTVEATTDFVGVFLFVNPTYIVPGIILNGGFQMNYQFKREDVDFYSNGTRCSAWLYLPEADKKCPRIVMAHGLGGTREMRLYEYAERFAAAGYAGL